MTRSRAQAAAAASLILLGLLLTLPATTPAQSISAAYRPAADRIIDAALADSQAWNRIAELTERYGARFSGTPALEQAIDWIIQRMKADGLDNVRGEPVMVPRWVRGAESAELITPRRTKLPMLGLGGSVGTAPGGITAQVVVVTSFEDLALHKAQVKGKIVLFNVPFTTYGATVQYRSSGAVEAAKAGAVASLVRSVTPYSMRTPHTGGMRYDSTVRKPNTASAW